jgi:hypothetical protein
MIRSATELSLEAEQHAPKKETTPSPKIKKNRDNSPCKIIELQKEIPQTIDITEELRDCNDYAALIGIGTSPI